ncbi:hypothetical protein ABZP36_020801 [Zizania latifolia]
MFSESEFLSLYMSIYITTLKVKLDINWKGGFFMDGGGAMLAALSSEVAYGFGVKRNPLKLQLPQHGDRVCLAYAQDGTRVYKQAPGAAYQAPLSPPPPTASSQRTLRQSAYSSATVNYEGGDMSVSQSAPPPALPASEAVLTQKKRCLSPQKAAAGKRKHVGSAGQ